jgi:hypothetical protein
MREHCAIFASLVPGNFLEPDGSCTVLSDLYPQLTLGSVIYFNLGSHHVPHSGDIPNTLMHTSASSVMFTPFNFHDRDPSRHSVQGVRLELGGERPQPRYFGGRHEKGVHLRPVSLVTVLMLQRCRGQSYADSTHEFGRAHAPSALSAASASGVPHYLLSPPFQDVADDYFS